MTSHTSRDCIRVNTRRQNLRVCSTSLRKNIFIVCVWYSYLPPFTFATDSQQILLRNRRWYITYRAVYPADMLYDINYLHPKCGKCNNSCIGIAQVHHINDVGTTFFVFWKGGGGSKGDLILSYLLHNTMRHMYFFHFRMRIPISILNDVI